MPAECGRHGPLVATHVEHRPLVPVGKPTQERYQPRFAACVDSAERGVSIVQIAEKACTVRHPANEVWLAAQGFENSEKPKWKEPLGLSRP
jgi:hypothetical protein